MSFLRPMAFIGLVIIPMILALYFFKRKSTEVKVSSVFLWNIAQSDLKASKSMQKLRKNLLMFLQLLGAFFCVLAMTSPYITAENDINKYNIVIDNSISMSAQTEDTTRLDMAKADAVNLVRSSATGSIFTVTQLNSTSAVLVSNSEDKDQVIEAIEGIEQSYVPVDYDIIQWQDEDSNTVFFSDRSLEGTSTYVYGEAFDNCGIVSLTTDASGDSIRTLAKVKNFGSASAQKRINLYVNGELYESEDVVLSPDETKDIIFTRYEGNSGEISASLDPSDGFVADDTAYGVVNTEAQIKVLLSGDVDPFLERAFGAIPDVIVSNNDTGNIENLQGYDLYVFEDDVPENLPSDGHIFLIDPSANSLFQVGEKQLISSVTPRDNTGAFFSLTSSISFDVYRSSLITLPDWADVIVSSPETPLIFAGEYGRQKIAVIGFDISESDLPLKKDFPIFVYDIINNFFPGGAVEGGNANVGEGVMLNISPLATEVRIITPDGGEEQLAPPFPVGMYVPDRGAGIYYLEQLINSSPVYEPFSVNIVQSNEQYFNYSDESTAGAGDKFTGVYSIGLEGIFILLGCIILIAEMALYIYRRRKNSPKFSVVMRGLVILLLVLAFADVKLPLPSEGVTTVFVMDTSDSMADDISSEIDFINQALSNKTENDYTALAAFGTDTRILAHAENDKSEYNPTSIPQGDGSNIQRGIEGALSLFKSGTGRRVVLLTDGSENAGDVVSTVRRLKSEDTEVKVLGYDHAGIAEVQITDLNVPEYLTQDSCNAEVVIESTAQETVNLQLYVDGTLAYEDEKEVTIGENRYVIDCPVNGEGYVEFRAVIEPVEDRYYQNNSAYANSYIRANSKVLLLEYEGSGANLEALFTSAGVDITKSDIASAPTSPEELNRYEAVILADCPYYDMSEEFVNSLVSYVKNSAGGLFVSAGENSLALGGYKDTPLETILPVNMDLTDDDRKRSTAIVMVVDRSGSMGMGEYGISKLELVKEAMVRSVQTLDEGDSVGVIAFDDNFSWMVEPTEIGTDTSAIEDKIYSINEGGGTSIQPALSEAVSKLSNYEADSKHIILMSDGQGEPDGYESIINTARLNGISISTVAVGSDSAMDLLQEIADKSDGRYYYTDEFSDLPRIFERETTLSDKNYINNETFYPQAEDSSPILDGIEALPALNGYIASSAKEAATVVLSHNGQEPVLAQWQYGLGTSAVFAADIENQCAQWMSTDEGQAVLTNTLAYIMRNRSFGNISTDVTESNGKRIITVETGDEAVTGITATLEGNSVTTQPLFEQVSPGVFEADAGKAEPGNYVLNLNVAGENGSDFYSLVISVPYSKEYDIKNIQSGSTLLESLYLNAQMITSPDEVFTPYNQQSYDKLSIMPHLIAVALILFFAELFYRRFKPEIKLKKSVKKEKEDHTLKPEPTPPKPADDKPEEKKELTSSILLKNKHKREK